MDSTASTEEYRAMFCQYFQELDLEQFEDLMLEFNSRHFYPVYVDATLLLNHNVLIGHRLITNPSVLLPIAETAAIATQECLMKQIEQSSNRADLNLRQSEQNYTIKRNVKVRILNLPLTEDFCKRSITALRTEDVGQLLSVRGIVIREGSVKMYEAVKEFACELCMGRGGSDVGRKTVECLSPAHGQGVVQRPPNCPGCGKQMTVLPTNQKLNQAEVASRLRDYQEIRVQDQVTSLQAGMHIKKRR